MATTCANQIASAEALAPAVDVHPGDGLGARLLGRLRQAFCGLHGHDNLLQFEQVRIFLKCSSCGHESPGWELTEAPPRLIAHGDTCPHRFVQAHLVGERRIA